MNYLVIPAGSSRLLNMSFLSIIVAIAGLGILFVGLLCLTENLPGNALVGLRIPEVRKSQDYWNMGHKIAGPAWTGSGLAMLAAGAVAWSAAGWTWLVVAGLVVASLFLLGMGGALAAHAMAQVDARAQKEADAESGCCSSGSSASSADASDTCCGGSSDVSPEGQAAAGGVVSADACASGQACGSCSLNGSCEGGGAAYDSTPALDLDAARRAVASQDSQ